MLILTKFRIQNQRTKRLYVRWRTRSEIRFSSKILMFQHSCSRICPLYVLENEDFYFLRKIIEKVTKKNRSKKNGEVTCITFIPFSERDKYLSLTFSSRSRTYLPFRYNYSIRFSSNENDFYYGVWDTAAFLPYSIHLNSHIPIYLSIFVLFIRDYYVFLKLNVILWIKIKSIWYTKLYTYLNNRYILHKVKISHSNIVCWIFVWFYARFV